MGDFIIITSLIYALKKKFPDAEIIIVGSKLNFNFIKKYSIIDEVIIYDKNSTLLNKYSVFKQIISKYYFASFSVDGKSFSNFCNFFIKSKYKFGIFYKSKLGIISTYKPSRFYKFIFNKYEVFTSKKNLTKIEHLPSKIISLGNYFNLNLKSTDKYYFKTSGDLKNFKNKYKSLFSKKYLLIHLDEKWCDIKDIKNNFLYNLKYLQKITNKIIVLTSYNNSFIYYKNLKEDLINNHNLKIILVENSNLDEMETLIRYSQYSISCHSGFLVQIAGSNSTKVIDIINKSDFIWYSSWIPKNTFHKFIYKSDFSNNYSLKDIINNLIKVISESKNL